MPLDARLDGSTPVNDARADADATMPRDPTPWADMGAGRRMKLSFRDFDDSGLDDFTVPVRLDADRIDHNVALREELRFYDTDGAPLPFEIERWSTDRGLVFVRVPRVDPQDDAIWLYFGGPPPPPVHAPEDTWPDDYQGVYHFASIGSSIDGPATYDSSQNDVDGWLLASGGFVQAPRMIEGALGLGAMFDGPATSMLELRKDDGDPDGFNTDEGERRTYEIWFSTLATTQGSLFHKEGRCKGFHYFVEGDGQLTARVAIDDDSGSVCGDDRSYYAWHDGVADGRWHSMVVVFDREDDELTLYFDGELAALTTDVSDDREANEGHARLGGDWEGGNRLFGAIDEVRVSNGAMSARRVRITHIAATDGLIAYGMVETRE